jgi:hypothetical protein
MIRVFVGTDGDIHADAERVLEYSIRTNTVEEVEIAFMRPGWKVGCTGFTTHRYLVPRLCDFEGFAIYLDVDMIVLGDLSELWSYRQAGKWCTTRPTEDAVSVIDCSAFRDLPSEASLQAPTAKTACIAQIGDRYEASIPEAWNVCDRLTDDARLVHYTDLATQPWRPYRPHRDPGATLLFFDYLWRANADG